MTGCAVSTKYIGMGSTPPAESSPCRALIAVSMLQTCSARSCCTRTFPHFYDTITSASRQPTLGSWMKVDRQYRSRMRLLLVQRPIGASRVPEFEIATVVGGGEEELVFEIELYIAYCIRSPVHKCVHYKLDVHACSQSECGCVRAVSTAVKQFDVRVERRRQQ